MDLESYIGRYSGETRLRRLISIAQGRSVYGAGNNNNNLNLNLNLTLIQRQHALDLAEKQMIKDGNVQLYRQVFAGNGHSNGEDTGGGGGRIFDMDLFEGKFIINFFLLNFFFKIKLKSFFLFEATIMIHIYYLVATATNRSLSIAFFTLFYLCTPSST